MQANYSPNIEPEKLLADLSLNTRLPEGEHEKRLASEIQQIKERGFLIVIPGEFV